MIRRCFCVVVFGLLLPSFVTAQAPSAGARPIIDMHLHAHPPEDFLAHRERAPVECALPTAIPPLDVAAEQREDLSEAYFQARLAHCTRLLDPSGTEDALIAETLEILQRYNVRAVTSSAFSNVRRWHEQAPERIVPAISLSAAAEVGLDSLRSLLSRGALEVIGEIGAQYLGQSPSDPSLDPVFALAEEFDVPVGIHIGLSAPGIPLVALGSYRAAASRPLDLEPVLLKYPTLRLYVMHAGWPMLDDMLHLMWSYPQVYVDVSAINWLLPRREFHAYLQRLVDAGFGKRIMFGSDQMVWPEAIEVGIESIQTASFLTEEEKRDILYHNAARFLRLGQDN